FLGQSHGKQRLGRWSKHRRSFLREGVAVDFVIIGIARQEDLAASNAFVFTGCQGAEVGAFGEPSATKEERTFDGFRSKDRHLLAIIRIEAIKDLRPVFKVRRADFQDSAAMIYLDTRHVPTAMVELKFQLFFKVKSITRGSGLETLT